MQTKSNNNYAVMDSNITLQQFTALTVGLCFGVGIGWILRSKLHKTIAKQLTSKTTAEQVLNDYLLNPECKLVLVVRNDLKMGKGKACAQCSHASVLAYQQAGKQQPDILKLWKLCGQRKVVVKVDDEQELLEVEKNAINAGLLTSLIRDAGHTQVTPGSKTVLGVGPGPTNLVDKVTGHLRLY